MLFEYDFDLYLPSTDRKMVQRSYSQWPIFDLFCCFLEINDQDVRLFLEKCILLLIVHTNLNISRFVKLV